MSVMIQDSIKPWTANRKMVPVVDIIQRKTMVAEPSRACDFFPPEMEGRVDNRKRGIRNGLRAKPFDIREQHEKRVKDLSATFGENKPQLRARVHSRRTETGSEVTWK